MVKNKNKSTFFLSKINKSIFTMTKTKTFDICREYPYL